MKRPRHRSPSYPAIALEEALTRARQMETMAGRHPAPVAEIARAWGYGPKSSGGRLALAALKKFGLMDDLGSGDARQGQLTDLSRHLLYYSTDRDSDLFRKTAQQAALTPKIHQELWERYGPDLPDDPLMRHYLVFDRAFSTAAADELLREFRSTLAYAGMTGPNATVSPNGQDSDEDTIEDPEEGLTPPTVEIQDPALDPHEDPKPLKQRAERTVQVTYSPTEWALLQGRFPMSEDDWDAMIAVLQAMKRGLVTSGSEQ
jgi:hypothetical protein